MTNTRTPKKAIWMTAASAAALGAMTAAAPAFAQDEEAASGARERIVVTAQRREESLQEVPAAVTALTPQTLEERQIANVLDLQYAAPNISLATNTGTSSGARVFLRGVGEDESRVSADPAVALYVDGVYIGRQVGGLFDLVDLERIEVLRGPQGTLYGRNSNGGAIRLVSAQPEFNNSGNAKLTIGNYNRLDFRATANLQLADATALRVTAATRNRDGFHRLNPNGDFLGQGKTVGDQETFGVRAVLRHDFNDQWNALFAVDYTDDSSDPVPDSTQPGLDGDNDLFTIEPINGGVCSLATPATFQPIGCFLDYRSDVENGGASLTVNGDIGGLTFQSLTGYRFLKDDLASRIGFPYLQETDQDQLSQEFTLATNNDGPLNLLGGLYFFQEDAQLDTVFVLPFELGIDTQAYAAFGQLTYDFSDALRFTGGVRFTDETKEIDAANTGIPAPGFTRNEERDFDQFTYSAVLDYQVNDDVMVYGSYSTGFKSGGWSPDCFADTACFLPVDEEELQTFEAGFRSDLFGDRLRFNGTYFFNIYDGLQIAATVPGLGFTRFNVSETEIQGFEFEAIYSPAPNLDIFANLGLLDGEYTELTADQASALLGPAGASCPGGAPSIACAQDLELKNAPSYKGQVGFLYSYNVSYGEYTFGADVNFEDESFNLVANSPASALTDPDPIFNARVAFSPADSKWEFALWGQNLSDEEYARASTATSFSQYAAPPLTFGVDIGVDF